VKDLTKNVASMLKTFQTDHGKMSEDLKETLAKAVKEIETYVKRRLKEFDTTHAEMSDALKKSLAKYVSDIVSGVKKLLGEYSSDMEKARAAWQGMAASLAKSRKGGVMPRIEAGEKVATVEEAVERKGERRGRKKKRGRK
jgi:gas vesicle protein